MVRVSSKGNPWHDDLGKFCTKEDASFIKCGDEFISCSNLSAQEKEKLFSKISKNDHSKFYREQSNKRLQYAKKVSIFKPKLISSSLSKEKKIKLIKQNRNAYHKAVKKFVKENKYHLKHGGQFQQFTDNNSITCFVCMNARRIYNETQRNQGASIDISTGMKAFDGYMVAKYQEKSKWIDTTLSKKEQIKELDNYLTNNLKQLSENSLYFGTWYDTESHKISIDISEQVASLDEAKKLGIERNEKAIWDVKNMNEIRTGGTGTNLD